VTNPAYFTAAVSSYLALGVIALFTVVPPQERAYCAPIVPLYLCYAIVHIIPMSVGFLNFFWSRSSTSAFTRITTRVDRPDTDR